MAKEGTLKKVFRKMNQIIDIILDGEIDIKKDVGDVVTMILMMLVT